MTAPTDSWSIASGATLYAGRSALVASPGWLTAHDAEVGLNTWRPIPNTYGTAGLANEIQEYSGFAEKNGMLITAWAGGHHLSDNSVATIDFTQNTPVWTIRSPGGDPTPSGQRTPDSAYYADGKPSSGHNRCDLWWSSKYNRVVRIGARDLYTNVSVGSKAAVSTFNLDSNTCDPAGTFPDISGGEAFVIGGSFIGVDGSFNTYSGIKTMTGQPPTWSDLTTIISPGIRAPWAVAPELNLVFGLAAGNGWGGGPTRAIKIQNGVQTAITINPSASLTAFEAAQPNEASMHYDAPNGRFVFHSGTAMWAIIPNGTNNWDMVNFTYGSGGASPTGNAISNRFIYSRTMKGFFFRPDGATSNIHFMRTSL